MTESVKLYDTVVKNDYCIGCGACAVVKDSPFTIIKDEFGNVVASVENKERLNQSNAKVLAVCPFSGESANEDEIGQIFFSKNETRNKFLGRYLATYAGYATNDNIRKTASSGGVGKWLAYTLLNENKVDYFIQVAENKSGEPNDDLFSYVVYDQAEAAIGGSTSAYYPTTLKDVIDYVKNNEGNYAITGVPCFIKALRLMSLQDATLKKRLKYLIGIVCGGMKSSNQAKMIAWQLGIHPNNLTKINFRGKDYGVSAATTKIYQVWGEQKKQFFQKNSGDIFGADYGMGFFKPQACDYCDDVVGETADISIGDVWLQNYRFDKKGYSLIVVRNEKLFDLISESVKKGTLHIENLEPEQAILSQQGGFRHRRDALSYRLQKKELSGEWYPKKRIKPGEFEIEKKRKKIYDLREEMGKQSHHSFLNALKKDDLSLFYKEMNVFIKKYTIANHGIWIVRMYNKVVRRLKRLL